MSSVSDANSDQSTPFEDRVQGWQDGLESGIRGLGKGSWARIIKMARKPSSLEFRQTCIVCGIGMFVLGFIGFVMLVLMDNVLPSFFEWLTN
ncbi:MAG: protein translocase SEC61 complex subunit gamma [Candidatus Thalassarchaeaceae archaeon]|jgi:protein transport protein SEC61 subunit gamma-like protein|nr:protein translocase SEC61 complex subunit gamma [Candidatus Thalassarchaeaceae archaeon]